MNFNPSASAGGANLSNLQANQARARDFIKRLEGSLPLNLAITMPGDERILWFRVQTDNRIYCHPVNLCAAPAVVIKEAQAVYKLYMALSKGPTIEDNGGSTMPIQPVVNSSKLEALKRYLKDED